MPVREPVIITAPTVEPVTISQLKEWSRIDFSDEDAVKLPLILERSRILFERMTGRTLHQTVLECYLQEWPSRSKPIVLPRAAPLVTVSAIAYKISDGTEQTWTSSEWIFSTRTMPGRVAPAYGEGYPTATLYPLDPIRIRYTAGIANASPQTYPDASVTSAILELASSIYEMPESEVLAALSGAVTVQLSIGAQALINFNRVEFC